MRILAHRQQFARLGVEDEDEPVKQDEGVVIDGLQRLRRGLQAVGGVIEKSLGEMAQRIIHLVFQRGADAVGVFARWRAAIRRRPSGPGSKAARRKKA